MCRFERTKFRTKEPKNQISNQILLFFVWFFGSLVRFFLPVPANRTKEPKNQKFRNRSERMSTVGRNANMHPNYVRHQLRNHYLAQTILPATTAFRVQADDPIDWIYRGNFSRVQFCSDWPEIFSVFTVHITRGLVKGISTKTIIEEDLEKIDYLGAFWGSELLADARRVCMHFARRIFQPKKKLFSATLIVFRDESKNECGFFNFFVGKT